MLNIKTKYQILGFKKQCPQNFIKKFLSIGLIPGNKFFVIGKSIFGTPYHISIKNNFFSIRNTDISLLMVQQI